MSYHNRFPPTRTQLTSSIGKGENSLQAIVISLQVSAEFNWPLPTPFHYGDGRQIVLKPDCHIYNDHLFKDGVIEDDGDSHKSNGQKAWDRRKDEIYEAMNLWCERMKPKDAKNREKVIEALGRHRR